MMLHHKAHAAPRSCCKIQRAQVSNHSPCTCVPGLPPPPRVSTIKYTLLMDLIQMGYHTLITDMDLVYMKNPFDHLHRCAAQEGAWVWPAAQLHAC